jgi:glycerate 2-kinase
VTPESELRALFDIAVQRALPGRVLPAHLPTPPKGRTVVVGAGKASAAMALVLEEVWPAGAPLSGLVITRYGHVPPAASPRRGAIRIVEARHPVPDAAGEVATQEMLSCLHGMTQDDLVIAVISGGASALMIAPAEGLSLADKQAVNAALLASGAPISQMNIVRKHLSRVKGGQLAAAAAPARVLSLMISDVPGDEPALIGSGPTVGDDSTPAEALGILDHWKIAVPAHVRAVLSRPRKVLAPSDPRLFSVTNRIIAAPSLSLAAAADLATGLGGDVHLLGDAIEGEAREVARAHAELALQVQAGLAPGARPVFLLSGGELTVTRRGDGIGGPNAEYCLALALALKGAPGIQALAADTDGVDGAAEVAGAMVLPQTIALAQARGLDPIAMLERNDAHSFFEGIGQQVLTGPTFTNVNDFRAIRIDPPS